MPQEPNISAATLANLRDAVAHEVWGVQLFSNLSAANQGFVTDEGNAAFYEVTQWARWYAEVNPSVDNLPNEWNEAFRAVWVSKCLRRFRGPQAGHAHWTTYVVPLLNRIADHYTKNWMSSSALADDTFTVQSIRNSALAICVRQRTPIFPPIREVDAMIRDEFVKLWEMRPWNFRRRSLELTITADGDLDAGSDYVFDGLASKRIFIKGSSEGTRYSVDWVDATRFAELAAYYDGKTGRPRYFYDIDQGDEKSIQFLPAPDKAYTAFAVILIGAPQFGSATSTLGLKNLPVPFRMNLRDMVTAKCLAKWGREDNDAARMLAISEGERAKLAASWDDKGASRVNARGHHQNRWAAGLVSARLSNVIGQSGG